MTDIAIRVTHLSKCYHIYNTPHDRLKQFIAPRLQRLIGRQPRQYFHEFWALNNISFEVKRGETVGIIGRNGSGKSTLLQLICGTLTPSDGQVEINGRVAALLELGAGFNPEFTGRENVYMNAAVLGLSIDEVTERFDDIVEFADIGEFIEQPVKTYSSGMFVRLAFAIAINVQPDILIIDEALAVGDMAFQAKCMAQLKRLMNSGATVLFVSHDTSSVRNFCSQVLWLNNGKMQDYGDPEKIIGLYTAEMHLSINKSLSKYTPNELQVTVSHTEDSNNALMQMDESSSFAEGWRRYGDGRARIINAVLLNSDFVIVENLQLRDNFIVRFLIRVNTNIESPAFGFSFRDLKGNQVIGSVTSNYQNITIPMLLANKNYLIEISGENILAQGTYTINLGIENIVEQNIAHEFIDVVENTIVFRSNFGSDPNDIFPAMVWQNVDFSIHEQ
jgi:lipopolysaccharide transport system ATP-binding protein